MALDRDKTRRNAERLLAQGKPQAALAEYRRLIEETPKDAQLLNTAGDLLARMGRSQEAVDYWERSASQFAVQGFFPRAAAVLAKVVRAAPDRPAAHGKLGELKLEMKLTGEAESHLLRAAELFVRNGSFAQARDLYQRLVRAVPGNPLHRVRLAETLALAGETEAAGESLLAVGSELAAAGRIEQAEKTYRRAAELLPGRAEPPTGVAACLRRLGRCAEAIAILEPLVKTAPSPALLSELLRAHDAAGGSGAVDAILLADRDASLPDDVYEEFLRGRVGDGKAVQAWETLDRVFSAWPGTARARRLATLLERLATVEQDGHIPALRRLGDLQQTSGDRQGILRSMRLLAAAYQSRGMLEEASIIEERLGRLGPAARDAEAEEATTPAVEKPAAATPAPETRPTARRVSDVLAVPSDRADAEFVDERMTQAGVFEKYGLIPKALEQLREITDRFPGHVPSWERTVQIVRHAGDRAGLRDAWAHLALALSAAGRDEDARRALTDATEAAPLPEDLARKLHASGLFAEGTVEANASGETLVALEEEEEALEPTPLREEPPTPGTPEPAVSRAVEPAATPAAAAGRGETVEETEILFEEEGVPAPPAHDGEASSPSLSVAPSGGPASTRGRGPSDDDLETIGFFIEQGMVDDAIREIASLRSRGFGGPELDALDAKAAAAPRADLAVIEEAGEEASAEGASEPREEQAVEVLFDDDLSSLTANLAAQLDEAESLAPGTPQPEVEKLEDVFAQFKEHVGQSVAEDDHKTHYDLGIAYKEMGLLDDAVEEFRVASASPAMQRAAFSMMALCQRERGDLAAAADHYRAALDLPGGDAETHRELRYELAGVLADLGDSVAALEHFMAVSDSDPGFKDVARRVEELKQRLGTGSP